MTTINTADVGIAIKDHFEGKTIVHLDARRTRRASENSVSVDIIDVSDPNNIIIYAGNRKFVARIIAC